MTDVAWLARSRNRCVVTLTEMSARVPLLPCDVWERCGGCPQMPLTLAAQARLKSTRVSDALAAAGLSVKSTVWHGGPEFEYRNRLRVRIDEAGRVRFFNPDKALPCAVLEAGVQRCLERLQAVSVAGAPELTCFTHAEVRGADADGRSGVCLNAKSDATPDQVRTGIAWLGRELPPEVQLGLHAAPDCPLQRYESVGVDLHVALDAFLQVNHAVNRALVTRVLELATQFEASQFLDLHAGCGNFSLPLAALGLAGVAVEVDPSAVRSLGVARDCARLSQLTLLRGRVENVTSELGAADLVVADPPRAGLGSAAPSLAALCTRSLLLVSCNAQRLASDLTALSPDFELKSIELFDMFPHTHHVETLAVLERR